MRRKRSEAAYLVAGECRSFQIILGHTELLRAVDHKVKLPNFTIISVYFIIDSLAILGQNTALDLRSADLVSGCSPPACLEKTVRCAGEV